ncbi:conserved Plasmodium protein [uncultured Mediterranean phage uvMED]|nr:conserved Plasmodium protein [uncultured Mediterranean phage uvMED]
MATEIDVGGIKFRGGKIFLIITVLSSFVGVLWGGFEVYNRYLSMEKKINSYTAPDLSGFDKRLDLIQLETEMLQSEMTMILEEVELVAGVAKELKNDLKADVRRIETIVEDVEQRVKQDGRDNSKDLKETVNELKEEMQKLEEKIDKRIKLALENPLSQLNG